ncbi:MAG: hypothetical protein O6952_01660 [Planctomycetota bacterium]|nr:hypothetical protein [Planctomycetota bacterium]
MRMLAIAWITWLAAAGLWADIVILKDGTRYEGKIIEKSSEWVKLEITSGGHKAELTIPRKDVKTIREVPIDYSQILPPREYYEKRLKEIGADDAQGHYDLGVFAYEKALYREAALRFEKAMGLDEVFRGRSREFLYKIQIFRERECKEAFERVLADIASNRILTAKAALEKFQAEFTDCELAKDAAVQRKLIGEKFPEVGRTYGADLAAIIVAVGEKAKRVCPDCEGRKTVLCSACGGSGDATCNLCEGSKAIDCEDCAGKAEVRCSVCKGYGKTERYEGRKRVREDCKPCKSAGVVPCEACKKGRVQCTLCRGKGVVRKGCESCSSEGKVACTTCEGSGEREPAEEQEEKGRRKRKFGGPR